MNIFLCNTIFYILIFLDFPNLYSANSNKIINKNIVQEESCNVNDEDDLCKKNTIPESLKNRNNSLFQKNQSQDYLKKEP